MNLQLSAAMRAIITIVILIAFAPVTYASKDTDREQAGLQKLGIGTTFGRWPNGVVQWVYNPTNKAAYFADDTLFVNLLIEAMSEIEGVSGVDFQYQGIDNAAVIGNFADGVVTIGWDNLNGAAGVAGPSSSCNGASILAIGYCQYVDGSVRFNNDIGDVDWDRGDAEASELGLIQVAMHEILHLLGLGHSEKPASIMYADPYTNLSHLHADDVDGLQSLYGESTSPIDPPQYVPPAGGPADPLMLDRYLAVQGNIQTEITSVGDGEMAGFVGLTWEVQPGDSADMVVVVEDPDGFQYTKRVDTRDCNAQPGFYCIYWFSSVSMPVLETYPGVWLIHAIVNGALVETFSLDVQFTPPDINEAPDASVQFDVTSGPGPLTVNATLTVTGDAEGDDITASWHVPNYGELASTISTGGGVDARQFTFSQDGDYEIYVAVNDDWDRYGAPGSGSEAGPGFRQLFRQIIHVGDDVEPESIPLLLRRTDDYPKWLQYEISGSDVLQEEYVPLPEDLLEQVAAVDDFDGDGDDDVLMRRSDNGSWTLFVMDGASIVESANVALAIGLDWQVATVDDFNGDGSSDVLLRHQTNGRWRMFLMDGTTVLESAFLEVVRGLQWEFVASGHFDLDGSADLLLRNTDTGVWRLYRFNGTTVVETNLVAISQFPVWQFESVADFNGDGRLDVLVRRTDNFKWRIYHMDGTTVLDTDLVGLSPSEDWQLASTADINLDGRADVLLRNALTEKWRIYLMNGTSIDATALLGLPGFNFYELQTIADFNFDGTADILMRRTDNGRWFIYFLDGTSVTSSSLTTIKVNLAWELLSPKLE